MRNITHAEQEPRGDIKEDRLQASEEGLVLLTGKTDPAKAAEICTRFVAVSPDLSEPPWSFRYASLYFCCAIEDQDNELITLEIIHRYVELLDKYFGSVCELDIIFNFEKAYFILDEFLLGGEAQETSKKNVLKAIEQADLLQEVRFGGGVGEPQGGARHLGANLPAVQQSMIPCPRLPDFFTHLILLSSSDRSLSDSLWL
uniref:Adaptor related protein complex 1 subunit sigma 2 n=1 Tax=Paramormyrops kingsleyae TaxID=1676925 RepID=A0A3B3QIF4_9TELE